MSRKIAVSLQQSESPGKSHDALISPRKRSHSGSPLPLTSLDPTESRTQLHSGNSETWSPLASRPETSSPLVESQEPPFRKASGVHAILNPPSSDVKTLSPRFPALYTIEGAGLPPTTSQDSSAKPPPSHPASHEVDDSAGRQASNMYGFKRPRTEVLSPVQTRSGPSRNDSQASVSGAQPSITSSPRSQTHTADRKSSSDSSHGAHFGGSGQRLQNHLPQRSLTGQSWGTSLATTPRPRSSNESLISAQSPRSQASQASPPQFTSPLDAYFESPFKPTTNNPSVEASQSASGTLDPVGAPGDLAESMAGDHNRSYQMMTFNTQQGLVQFPVETQAASKVADEKRRRNAGASARFRARRKDKEREASSRLSDLYQQIRELQEDAEYYMQERNYFAAVVYQGPDRNRHFPRPSSPRRDRANQRVSATSSDTAEPGRFEPFFDEKPNETVGRRTRSRFEDDLTEPSPVPMSASSYFEQVHRVQASRTHSAPGPQYQTTPKADYSPSHLRYLPKLQTGQGVQSSRPLLTAAPLSLPLPPLAPPSASLHTPLRPSESPRSTNSDPHSRGWPPPVNSRTHN